AGPRPAEVAPGVVNRRPPRLGAVLDWICCGPIVVSGANGAGAAVVAAGGVAAGVGAGVGCAGAGTRPGARRGADLGAGVVTTTGGSVVDWSSSGAGAGC